MEGYSFSQKKNNSKHKQMRQLTINTSNTVRNDGLLDRYLNEISRILLITTEEEIELAFFMRNFVKYSK